MQRPTKLENNRFFTEFIHGADENAIPSPSNPGLNGTLFTEKLFEPNYSKVKKV